MKITKYLVVALLLVTIGKKTLFASEINPDGTITGPPSFPVSGGWVTDRERHRFHDPISRLQSPSLISTFSNALHEGNQPFTVDLQGTNGIMGSYNADQGTAKIEFSQVITTSQSVTPPSVSNPNYVAFGSIPNPNYKPEQDQEMITGGESRHATLWGIPVHSATGSPSTDVAQPIPTQSTPKKYTPSTKTATMKDGSVYVGVVEYSRSVTPPNIAIPALIEFATIKNSKSSSTVSHGGQSKNIALWGLKVTGRRRPIKQKNKTIGDYWPESNIAQLNNGQTIVAVIQEQQGNYMPHTTHAMGPVWTRYSDEQIQSIAQLYKTSPSRTNIDPSGIGTVKIDGQKNILYGIVLQQGSALSNTSKTVAALATRHHNLLGQQQSRIPKEEEIPGAEQFRQSINMSAAQAAAALYNIRPR